jgi:hypothetical protein
MEAITLNGEYKSLGLWLKGFTKKDGTAGQAISGSITIRPDMVGDFYISIYKNADKSKDTSPDYSLTLTPIPKKD